MHWPSGDLNTTAFLYVLLQNDPSAYLCRSILLSIWGRIHLFFPCPGTFFQQEKKMETLGLEGKMHKAKNKDNAKGHHQQKLVSVYAKVKAGQWGVEGSRWL